MLVRNLYCSIMSSRRRDSCADGVRRATTSRRALLTASGAVAIGALSGCLDRVASSATNTTATPAAVFAGAGPHWNDDETTVGVSVPSDEPHVSRLTPTLEAGSGVLSGEVELEGWVTSTALVAPNYNNSRSDKSKIRAGDGDADADGVGDGVRGEDYNTPRSNRSIVRPSDFFGDDVDESDETFRVVSRLDAQLQEATTAAATAISKRSARTGRNPETGKEITASLDEMAAVLAEMRAELGGCSDGPCVAALTNVADREADVRRAREYAENGEWEAFGMTDGGGDDILVGDYLLPPLAFDPAGLFSADEQAALFRYLDGETTAGERFTVCIPDAEVPGGNGRLRDEVTPQRFIDYMTGRTAGGGSGGSVYAWGNAETVAGDETGDCDDEDESVRPGDVCGSPHLSAAVSGPTATVGGLRSARGSDGTVVVVNDPPQAEGGTSILAVPAEGGVSELDGLDEWERGADGVPVVIGSQGRLLVSQVMVQPPGCPHPFPGLMYVSRGVSDGQLVHSGGWVIDDGALYADSVTVLTMESAARIVGVDFDDLESDGDGLADVMARQQLDARTRQGARLYSAPFHAFIGYMLSEGGREGADALLRKRPGRTRENVGTVRMSHLVMDVPTLHLVNAGRASTDVKFKTGAELSKIVN
jgi:hypothetical protein